MKEFERRWVVDYPELASEKLESLSLGKSQRSKVKTTYLSPNWRLKRVIKIGSINYYLTKKMPKNASGFRKESTIELNLIEYSRFIDKSPRIVGSITYERCKIIGGANYDNHGITELCIDQVVGGPMIIEVEFKDEDSMNNFKVLDSMKEIAMPGSYKYYLVKKGYCSQ